MSLAPGEDVASSHGDAYRTRLKIRRGLINGTTSGLVSDHLQANLVILPAAYAENFVAFCSANQQACPLLSVSRPGDPSLPGLGHDIDIRHDVPGYRVFRRGEPTIEVADVEEFWRGDLVTCAIGCSFTFEATLIKAGIPLRHVAQGLNVAMFETSRATAGVGPFGGPLVVSMRPLTPPDAARAAAITARFENAHGAPVHVGDPSALGIAELNRPDYGEAVSVEAGEVPVFWACGVTSQRAAETADLPFFIAHAPGKMLITDLKHPASA